MLHTLRLVGSILLFGVGCYLIVDLVLRGFDLLVLLGGVLSFVLAHYLKPRHVARGSGDRWGLGDAIDLIVDLPFRAIASALRALGAALRTSDLDFD